MSLSQRRTIVVAFAAALLLLAMAAAIHAGLGSGAPTRSAGWTWDDLPTD